MGRSSDFVAWGKSIAKGNGSLARTILVVVGLALISMQFLSRGMQLYDSHKDIATAAEKRADAALDMLASVHTQAMMSRKDLSELDGAIATLNGTMEKFSQKSRDVQIWVSMGPKTEAFQRSLGETYLELPQDDLERDAIRSLEIKTAADGNSLRKSRPVILGQGMARDQSCNRCHTGMMGIQPGEVIGTYNAKVDMTKEKQGWQSSVQRTIQASVLVTALTVLLIFLMLRKRALMPLRRLTESTHLLADGHLNVPIEDADREDEIGEMAQALAIFRTNLLEKRKLEEDNAYMARHDQLTGLPNRMSFDHHLDGEIATASTHRQKIAVIGIDLDRFKDINDRHGHSVGDRVLTAVADRVKLSLRDHEMFARFGGDEFSAVKRFTDLGELDDFLCRLHHALNEPVVTEDLSLAIGGSIGVSLFPEDAMAREALVTNADLAMYRAKVSPDTNLCFYEEKMDERARARAAMAVDLRSSIRNDEFELHYQPQNDIKTGKAFAYEALLRWNRPGYGFVPPAEFIAVAEECGMIHEIGEWVLRSACQAAAKWDDNLRIAVNISAIQLGQKILPQRVHEILLETGLAPRRLELEITETAIIADKVGALHKLRQIKALGVSIAIDDFGSGYSSLDTLNSFPFDKIKIDKSFLQSVENRPKGRALIRAILAIGQSLEVPVLAEGVETEEQLAMLRAEGCAEVQGFLFGRPVPECELNAAPGARRKMRKAA